MRLRAAAVLSTVVLLAACGGGEPAVEDGPAPVEQGDAPVEDGAPAGDEGGGSIEGDAPGQTYPEVDLQELVGGLESEWGVDCGEPLVDMAGYPKIVCGIPDDLMSPGMSSNAVSVQGFTEDAQAQEFRDLYVPDDGGFVQGEGWFVNAPTQEIADEAASLLE